MCVYINAIYIYIYIYVRRMKDSQCQWYESSKVGGRFAEDAP
jgi:hypothetical protein